MLIEAGLGDLFRAPVEIAFFVDGEGFEFLVVAIDLGLGGFGGEVDGNRLFQERRSDHEDD